MTPMKSHEQVIKANLIGHMNDAHAVLPFFLRQGCGVFINMISLGGFAAASYAAAYSASKFGLKGFSEALRAELSEFPHIHICDIYPAFVDTPGISHGANYVGRELTAPPPVYDARKVARQSSGLQNIRGTPPSSVWQLPSPPYETIYCSQRLASKTQI